MSRVGFEPMIPVFEWAKTVHGLERAATVVGQKKFSYLQILHLQEAVFNQTY
jgi:hypothetical protein